MSLLLLLLLDERGLVNYEEGSTLMKAINVLMLKVRASSLSATLCFFDFFCCALVFLGEDGHQGHQHGACSSKCGAAGEWRGLSGPIGGLAEKYAHEGPSTERSHICFLCCAMKTKP